VLLQKRLHKKRVSSSKGCVNPSRRVLIKSHVFPSTADAEKKAAEEAAKKAEAEAEADTAAAEAKSAVQEIKSDVPTSESGLGVVKGGEGGGRVLPKEEIDPAVLNMLKVSCMGRFGVFVCRDMM